MSATAIPTSPNSWPHAPEPKLPASLGANHQITIAGTFWCRRSFSPHREKQNVRRLSPHPDRRRRPSRYVPHFWLSRGGPREASRELASRRAAENPDVVIERGYVYDKSGDEHGENAGEPIPQTREITAERGSDDLKAVRNLDDAARVLEEANARVREIEAARFQSEYEASQAASQQAEPVAQQVQQSTTPTEDIQQLQQPTIPGVDPDLVAEVQKISPKFKAALEAEMQQLNQQRVTFEQGLKDARDMAIAGLHTLAPEVAALVGNPERLNGAMAMLAANNPQRHAAVASALARVETTFNTLRNVENHNRQMQAQRAARVAEQERIQHEAWQAAENRRFADMMSKENPAIVKQINDRGMEIMERKFNMSEPQVREMMRQPIMQSAAAKQILMKAIAYEVAQENAARARPAPLPPVVRAGVQDGAPRSEVPQLRRNYDANEKSMRELASVLSAQRRAAQ